MWFDWGEGKDSVRAAGREEVMSVMIEGEQ